MGPWDHSEKGSNVIKRKKVADKALRRKTRHFAELRISSEEGSNFKLIDFHITQL